MVIKNYALAAAFTTGVIAAGWVQQARMDNKILTLEAEHAEYVQSVTDAASEAVKAHAIEADRQRQAVAQLDTHYTEALSNAEAEADSLRAAVRSGERRLYVKTTAPADCSGVPKTTGPTGVGDAEGRAELDSGHAERIIAITERGDQAIRQLAACQDYVKTFMADTP